MDIVDAQVHIWAASTPERPWPPGRHGPHREVPFSKDDLLAEMGHAGVAKAIIVPPMWEGDRNDLALEAARLHPGRFAVMGRFDLESPPCPPVIAAWRGQPGMLGLRLVFSRPSTRALLVDGRLDWLWVEAEAASIPITMLIDHQQIDFVRKIAERHRGLKLSMDHLGLAPDSKDEAAFADLDKLLALAAYPNVAVKVDGMPVYTTDEYPYRRLHPHLKRVYDAFGPQRMFWGSDLTKLPCTYRQAVTMFTEEMPWLTPECKSWIMGRGVCAWFGWRFD
jgi:predicted TIM-barrel fold metal-dependent hydrolase